MKTITYLISYTVAMKKSFTLKCNRYERGKSYAFITKTTVVGKILSKICGIINNTYLCNALHFTQATKLANLLAGIFYVLLKYKVPSRVVSLMRPLPESGVTQRGAELFCSFPRHNRFIVSF